MKNLSVGVAAVLSLTAVLSQRSFALLRMTGEWVLVGSMRSGVFLVILNAVKNLSERGGGRAIVDGRAIPEILRFTQDDRGMDSMGSGVFFVILNAVKNLAEQVYGRAIVDCRAIPEIPRPATP